MASQLNDPPVFGGVANANIRANVNTPLNLLTSGNNGVPLPNAPTLQVATAEPNGTASVEVILLPFNYPPQSANVVFKYREAGTQVYIDFPISRWVNSPPLNAWIGEGYDFLQGTAYEVIATSGIFISPVLRFTTGTFNAENPTAPPTAPMLSSVPTDTSMVLVFNGGFTGNTPSIYSYSVQISLNGTTWAPAQPATNAFGSLWVYIPTGLTPSTTYYFRSVVSYNAITFNSASSPPYQTAASGGVAPSPAPDVPTFVSATSSSITVTFTGASGQTGTAPISYGVILYENSVSGPGVFVPATVVTGTATVTATGLVEGEDYFFESVAVNSGGSIASVASAPFQCIAGPVTPLKTNIVTPFLIQGPRFNTPYSQALDYYINVDAVGCFYAVGTNTRAQGQQLFGSMYGKSSTVGISQPNLSGLCIADQPYNEAFGPISDAYLKNAQSQSNNNETVRLLASWGGFYADILGLFGPYQPVGYPGTNPSASDVTRSFLYNFCGITSGGNTNPLGWSRQGYTTYYDGLVLDFENVGLGGNPNVTNQYPVPQSPEPAFPADATNPIYSSYSAELASIVTTWYSVAPTLFLGNAPVSLSICSAETLAAPRNGNICASNSALNTWFAFTSASVVPSSATYNATASLALNHPEQLSYFDDIFVQFYNENKDDYLGGVNFANLLAQWGYLALLAQALGRKKTLINIGLASGNIIPGFNAQGNAIVPDAQGPTPQLDGEPGPPFTFWYPQYGASSPPNQTNPAAPQTWPNTGPTLDAVNLANAISEANTILQNAFGNPLLVPSDWCSGTGFWAGGNATTTANQVYSGKSSSALSPGTILPATNVYLWSDASYPSPNPLWTNQNLPVPNNLNSL